MIPGLDSSEMSPVVPGHSQCLVNPRYRPSRVESVLKADPSPLH